MEDLDIISLLTRSGTYILAVAVFVLTFFVRKIVELMWPKLKKQSDANEAGLSYLTPMARWWNEVILYAVPVVIGGLSSVVGSEQLYGTLKGQAATMFGMGVGWFSSFLYKTVKRMIAKKSGVPEDSPNFPPVV